MAIRSRADLDDPVAVEQVLAAHVTPRGDDECEGYHSQRSPISACPMINVSSHGKQEQLHVPPAVWLLAHGSLTPGCEIRHRCGNKWCCKLAHLTETAKKKTRVCRGCGKPRGKDNAGFCSQACYWASRRLDWSAACEHCKRTYVRKQRGQGAYSQKYCSRRCAWAAVLMQRRASRKPRPLRHRKVRAPRLVEPRRGSARYTAWRRAITQRDRVCQDCGATEYLRTHHIKPWAEYPEGRYDVANGLLLCVHCHARRHPDIALVGYASATSPAILRTDPQPPRPAYVPWCKLTHIQVAAIRMRFVAGGISRRALATEYGVSHSLIKGIVSGKLHPDADYVPSGRCIKLTAADVYSIRQRFAAGAVTKAALARQFGVSESAVRFIIQGRCWREP